jgi:nucleotide-binding universal stress UspA family protein
VDEHDVDHVVMGSNGRRGVSRLVLGSVAERVVRGAPVPVTVVR